MIHGTTCSCSFRLTLKMFIKIWFFLFLTIKTMLEINVPISIQSLYVAYILQTSHKLKWTMFFTRSRYQTFLSELLLNEVYNKNSVCLLYVLTISWLYSIPPWLKFVNSPGILGYWPVCATGWRKDWRLRSVLWSHLRCLVSSLCQGVPINCILLW